MRVCTKCGETKQLNDFPKYSSKGKNGRRKKCKKCHNKDHLKYIYGDDARRAKKKIYDDKWRKNNPNKVKAYRDKQKNNMKKYADFNREKLTDRYIRNRLGLSVNDEVSQELIESKRLQIKIQRLLEEQGYEQRNRTQGRFS